MELLVNVPFPPRHGPGVHRRVRVVVESLLAPLIVLTTSTAHVSAIGAPEGVSPGPALALVDGRGICYGHRTRGGGRTKAAIENALMTTKPTTIVCDVNRKGGKDSPRSRNKSQLFHRSGTITADQVKRLFKCRSGSPC